MQFDRPIIAALILFIVLLLAFFLVFPEYKIFRNLRSDFAEKRAEYNAKFDYYSAIEKAYNSLQSRPDALLKVNNALPVNPQLGNIVYYFQKTASENGIILTDLFLSKLTSNKLQESNEGSVKTTSFTLNLTGSYSALQRFIASLEKSARIFEVTTITFSSPQGGSATPGQGGGKAIQVQQMYNFTLQVETHSY